MTSKRITDETTRTLDGTELVRLATPGTPGSNWKAMLSAIFGFFKVRRVMTAATTYYVNNSTGNDANTGLSSGAAFATINKAVSVICDDTYWKHVQPTISVAKTGVNYNELVLLRPWHGSTPDFAGCAIIVGDSTDPSHQTGVLIKPITNLTTPYGAVEARGDGARWSVKWISVDGSGNSASVQGCYAALDGAYLRVLAGDMGPISDPFGQGTGQISVFNGATFYWDTDYATTSHIYGAAVAGTYPFLALVINDSICNINAPIIFDHNPGYYVVFDIEQNSFFQLYHQVTIGGVAVTGQRIFLRENSRGNTRLTTLPGDSWTAVNVPVDASSVFNYLGFPYGALFNGYSKSGSPTTTELPAGQWGVFKNTTGGGVVIAYNDAGTIKTATLT